MGIFVKAVAQCEGWYGYPKGKKFQRIPCSADNGKPASIDIDLELSQHDIADVGGDNRPAVVMRVVDDKGYRFNPHANCSVQCPVCNKIVADVAAAYKAEHPDDDNEALSIYF